MVLLRSVKHLIGRIIHSPMRICGNYYKYDQRKCAKCSGAFLPKTKGKSIAKIIVRYHVVEKGLTMPERHLFFGIEAVRRLIDSIMDFEKTYGQAEPQVNHAIGVVKAYFALHENADRSKKAENKLFWDKVEGFVAKHPAIPLAAQPRVTRDVFYENVNAPFPSFARARHTVRHYSAAQLPKERIIEAVALASTTPTACNRQYCSVYCVSDKEKIKEVLTIQGGSRGFGHLADKLLVVVSDLEGMVAVQERNDVFTNGGMFLMNLCYSLFYCKIAHCVLNWSRPPADDLKLRRILPVKDSEVVVALLTCGEAPDEFDVASSPRKSAGDFIKFA